MPIITPGPILARRITNRQAIALGLLRSGGAGVSYFDFGSPTFTPAMAKRTAPGPFAAAPIVQGGWTENPSDVITLSRGTQISGNFYANYDGNQGSFAFWFTPEFDTDSDHGSDFIWLPTSVLRLSYSHPTSNLTLFYGNADSFDVSHTFVAGTTYCIVCRWDAKNTLDGTNYACISIDDVHTFGGTGSTEAAAPGSSMYFGNWTQAAANAIIEGLTIYRRPLWNGFTGVDVGNGDEIAAIYASGSGKDPCEVTGSWDVCFCLPTNSTPGALVTGTGEAWSHPHASNVLTDWHAMTTYASSAWSTKGTPSTGPADAATADKVFAGGYSWTADADAEGISQGKTGLTAGQNYVLRCIAVSDTADNIRIRITDDTNAADIVSYLFGASSTRTAPGVAIITWELPTIARNGAAADCVAMTVAVEATAASQTVTLHQCEILNQLIDNPSMETGAVADPWVPDGWATSNLDTGDSEQETTTVHSGSSSIQFNTGSVNEGLWTNPASTLTANLFYGIGGWFFGDGVGGMLLSTAGTAGVKQTNGNAFEFQSFAAAAWNHLRGVMRSNATGAYRYYVRALATASGVKFFDDAYLFALTPVSLTATAASEANSSESTGLRVDGRDTAVEAIPAGKLTATSGHIRFRYTPRHSAADAVKFGTTPFVVECTYDASWRIYVYWSAANTLALAVRQSGTTVTASWDATGAIVAGTTYQMQIDYDDADCTLSVDGGIKVTVSPGAGIDFGVNIPTTLYVGTNRLSVEQADATFAAPA